MQQRTIKTPKAIVMDLVSVHIFYCDLLSTTKVNELVCLGSVYTGREAKAGDFRAWSLSSIGHNRPTTHLQFCLNEVKQPFAKFATG